MLKMGRIFACLTGLACLVASAAQASDWPAREIKWIVPFGPGGGADVVSRIVAAELSKKLGKQVVIENKPGASSVIGTRQIAEAAPDGYTIGLLTVVHPVNVAVGQRLPYDVDKDFAYLTRLIRAPMMLVVNSKKSLHSLADVVAYAKKNPGKLTEASIGPATPHHLLMQWLNTKAGIESVIVPFRSIPEALQATVSGEVDMMFLAVGGGADKFVENGSLTLVGVTSEKRPEDMPNVPTIIEQGVPGFVDEPWYGLVAPARTPPDVLKRLGDEVRQILRDEDVKRRIRATGAEAAPTTPQEFDDLVRRDTAKYKSIVQSIKQPSQ